MASLTDWNYSKYCPECGRRVMLHLEENFHPKDTLESAKKKSFIYAACLCGWRGEVPKILPWWQLRPSKGSVTRG